MSRRKREKPKKQFKVKKVKVSEEERKEINEKKEFYCSICFDIFVEPVKMPECNHHFCKRCLLMYLESQEEHSPSELMEKPKKKAVLKERIILCPICKAENTVGGKSIIIDKEMVAKVNERFQDEYKRKKKEETIEKKHTLTLLIGNKHEKIKPRRVGSKESSSNHEWSVFIKLKKPKVIAKKLNGVEIKKVQFELHKDFGVGKVYKPPWEIKRRGYGTFPVKIWIHFDRMYRIRPVFVDHELSFEKSGKFRKVEVDFSER